MYERGSSGVAGERKLGEQLVGVYKHVTQTTLRSSLVGIRTNVMYVHRRPNLES
jgi:hypothetical protein